MKVKYDAATDTLTITLRDAPVAESDEDGRGWCSTTTTAATSSRSRCWTPRSESMSPGP